MILSALSVLLLLILFSSRFSYAQLNLRMNGEFGYYKSTGEESFRQDDVLTRFDGSLKYNYKDKIRSASVQLRGRPEFYRFKNSISSVKIKADGSYSHIDGAFIWGADLSRQKNLFNGRGLEIDYDILTAAGHLEWNIPEVNSFLVNFGYAYQAIRNGGSYKLDLFFSDLIFLNSAERYFKYGLGIYAERFLINNRFQLIENSSNSEVNLMSSGWRYGPELSLSYLKRLIVTADYRFLIHESKFTKNLSYEHWIRLIAGIIFLDDWSVFILADYYTRRFKLRGNALESVLPLYTPLNLENRIYLKLSRILSRYFEVYSKLGYFRDNLYENELSVEGWNLLIGLEFSWQ